MIWKCKPAKNSLIVSPFSLNEVQNPQHDLQGPVRSVLSSLPSLTLSFYTPVHLLHPHCPTLCFSQFCECFSLPLYVASPRHSSGVKLNIISSGKMSFLSLPLRCDKLNDTIIYVTVYYQSPPLEYKLLMARTFCFINNIMGGRSKEFKKIIPSHR